MRIAAILLLACVLGAVAFAQEVVISGQAGFNADSPYNRLYNTRTVVTVKGRVVGQTIAAPMPNMANAITILVKTAQGKTWNVDVGPEWYVNNQRTRIRVKDNVQVTGSRVTIDGHDVILAEMIVNLKTRNVLTLRRPMGRPYWDAVYVEAPGERAAQSVAGSITGFNTFADGTNGTTQSITIHTDNGDVTVALAPDWFMRRQAVQLALGQYVNVNAFAPGGIPTQVGSGLIAPPIVFATSLNVGSQWMVLRSVNGRPMWFGIDGG